MAIANEEVPVKNHGGGVTHVLMSLFPIGVIMHESAAVFGVFGLWNPSARVLWDSCFSSADMFGGKQSPNPTSI